MRRNIQRSRVLQGGFTLIELMVSLVIGFAVVGALLAAYMASVRNTTHSDAMVQMTEDATQALNIMRAQTAMAGYSVATGVGGNTMTLRWTSAPVYGCALQNFGSPMSTGTTEGSLPCTGTSTSDALEVAYEAVGGVGASSNSIVNSAGQPLDCLGNQITAEPGITPPLYINDSKFYIDPASKSLNCYPRHGTGGAPLVDHVEDLRVTYGLSHPGGVTNQIEAYTGAPTPGDWDHVTSVTICVQVRSANKVFDTTSAPQLGVYVNCANTKTTNSDGYLRRTFSTTVVLQNKLL